MQIWCHAWSVLLHVFDFLSIMEDLTKLEYSKNLSNVVPDRLMSAKLPEVSILVLRYIHISSAKKLILVSAS